MKKYENILHEMNCLPNRKTITIIALIQIVHYLRIEIAISYNMLETAYGIK